MTGEQTQALKDFALKALDERRKERPSARIDNAALYAGSPMYYYCASCGWLAAMLPETHLCPVPRLCHECAWIKEQGWSE